MEKNLILTKAQNSVLAHDWTTAARLYKELLKTDSSNVEYLKELGSIYVKAGEDEKAIPYYEQIINFYPHYIDAMNSLGAIYRRLKRYNESIQILQRALAENRDLASVNYNLGFTYKEMGKYEEAIDAFESVITENPDDVLAYNHLGSIYLAQKNYEKSISTYKRGLQVDPNHPILNYNLARCYEEAKSYPDSIRCYEIALKTRPGWTDAIQDFSKLLVKCQLTKQAQEIVEQSIKLHPADSGLLYLLGDIYMNQFDFDNASKTFSKAEKINPDDVRILTGLAEALENGDKVELALDKILAAMEKEPENRDIKKQYVHTLLTAKQYDKALENVKDLYENDGDEDLQVLDLYGQYYICRGDDQTANVYYDKIKKLNHAYRDYMLGAANRYVQTGNYEKAEEIAKSFVARNERNNAGHTTLGKIYEKQGKFEKAKYEYSQGTSPQNPNAVAIKGIKNADLEMEKHPVSPEPIFETTVSEAQIPEAAEAQNEGAGEATPETAVYTESGFPPHLEAEESDIFAEDKVPGSEDEIEEEPEQEEETEEENNELTGLAEGVDRTKYGDNLPLSDALVEDDSDFWSEFADEPEHTNPLTEDESGESSDEEKSDSAGNDFNPFAEPEFDEPEEPKLQFVKEPEDEPAFEDPAAMEAEPEPVSAPVQSQPAPAPAPQQMPAPQPAPMPQQMQMPQPIMQPGKSDYERQLEQKLQEATMNSAEHALQTALNTQKIAQQMLDEQKRLSEQFEQEKEQIKADSEKLILDTINKKMEEAKASAEENSFTAEDEVPAEENSFTNEDEFNAAAEEVSADENEFAAEEATTDENTFTDEESASTDDNEIPAADEISFEEPLTNDESLNDAAPEDEIAAEENISAAEDEIPAEENSFADENEISTEDEISTEENLSSTPNELTDDLPEEEFLTVDELIDYDDPAGVDIIFDDVKTEEQTVTDTQAITAVAEEETSMDDSEEEFLTVDELIDYDDPAGVDIVVEESAPVAANEEVAAADTSAASSEQVISEEEEAFLSTDDFDSGDEEMFAINEENPNGDEIPSVDDFVSTGDMPAAEENIADESMPATDDFASSADEPISTAAEMPVSGEFVSAADEPISNAGEAISTADESISSEDEFDSVDSFIDNENPAPESVEREISGDEEKFLSTEELIQAEGELITQEKLQNNLENSKDASIDMLGKIEKILCNQDQSKEYSAQIELFKKLRTLSSFLPEKERNSVFSSKIRVMIEYVISKMSGRPGLLLTAESLIKSGVLGENYSERLKIESNKQITNELIKEVIQNMKTLAQSLEDKELSKALIISADGILEQIDLMSQKGEIF